MAIRILHRFSLPPAEDQQLVTQARNARGLPGCLEAEVYRGFRVRDDVAVTQLWEDEAAHDAYATAVADGTLSSLPAQLAARDGCLTEAYVHEYIASQDGIWTAVSQQGGRRIVWPARGPVRVVIQSCLADPDAQATSLMAVEQESLREPGCLEFAWMRGVEDPQHILLTELWSSQRVYDQHWMLRRRTGSGGEARRRAERTFGNNGAEFYRQQEFRLLYGRWLPADENAWSATVTFPAS